MFAALEDGPPGLAAAKTLQAQNEAEFQQRMDALARKAGWSKDQQTKFALRLLENPDFSPAMSNWEKNANSVLTDLQALNDPKASEADQCRIVLGMLERALDASKGYEADWRLANALLDREAARLGFSLD